MLPEAPSFSLFFAEQFILFERSEFLIATSKKKSVICACVVCSTNLGFSGEKNSWFQWGVGKPLLLSNVRIMYHMRMYLVSAGYPDTYVPGISRQTNVPPVDSHV